MQTVRLALRRLGRALARAWTLLLAIPGLVARCWHALRATVEAVVSATIGALRWLRDAARAAFRWLLRLGRATLLVAGLGAILALVLGGSAFAATRLAVDYGAGKERVDAIGWAGRPASYAGGTCATCHPAQREAALVNHATVSCEGCHGPLAGHPATDGGTASRLVLPDSDPCVTCHVVAGGRPASFPQVDPEEHYGPNQCLSCHDPHDVVASDPPDVTHPLVRLPACTTCHAPDGLKEVPAGHEMVADAVCLSCHRVPDDDD